MTEISARSRRPTTVEISMLSSKRRAFGVQHRGLAGFHDVLWPAHVVRRVGGDDLAHDQPVEQHADRGEVWLDRWFFEAALHRFNVGRDVQRLDVGERADLVFAHQSKNRTQAR
jgi:hypothetical protein